LTINSFLKGTTDGYIFATDIFRGGATFNVAAKVPEPATWLLFFAGLAGLTLLQQRRRKAVRAI
jgi:mannose/fructose-specific phosphotransferase system component IIA